MLKSDGFYLLRAPYLPVSCAEEILDNPARTREILTNLCENKDIQEAIFLASPILFNELETYLSSNNNNPKVNKIEQSLLKYIIRACSRCTPYGMFAGVSRGVVGDKTNIILTAKNEHTSVTRLDMQLLEIIVQNIALIPEVHAKIKFYPNSSGYVINNRLNYFESKMLGRTKTFNLSSVEYTEHIKNVFELARNGATKKQFRDCFNLNEFDIDEVDDFINELIDNEVIVHNFFPSLTCDNVLANIIEKINKIDNLSALCLDTILQPLIRMKNIIEAPIQTTEKKARIEVEIEKSFKLKNYDNDFFQVDLKLGNVENKISEKVIEEIINQVEEISSIMPNTIIEDLEFFKMKYSGRFENQEMPITEILDPEYGIGYGNLNNHTIGASVLLGGITNFISSSVPLLRLDAFQNLKQQKLFEALHNGLFEINITPQDIDFIKSSISVPRVLPDSCYIMGSLIGENSTRIDAGNYKFKLDYFNGPSAATLLARFCHTDHELRQKLKVAIKNEEIHKDAIYAEIVHSPQPRLGNVIHRPVLREYEIPYLSESGNAKEKCIDINDLFVSVINGEVILRSKRLNRRVIPCLSSAQNFRFASLPIYKFLCDLQHQGIMASFVWDWDGFRRAKFLPRVIYKKIILSPATWNIDEITLKQYSNFEESKDLSIGLTAFRKEFNVPTKVLLLDGDNKLLIDLDNNKCHDILFKYLQNNQYISLSESFISPCNCIVQNVNGESYANEIIIPVSKTINKKETTPILRFHESINPVQRKFNLGSEWIFIKIYGGAILLDNILKTKIVSLVKIFEENNIIDKWFFIRYNDPENHIRLRFHLTAENHLGEAIRLLNETLSEEILNKTIYKIQYDAYERELERYGDDMIENCESLFWRDSTCIINMLSTDENYDENSRMCFALRSIDEYLNSFNIDILDRIHFTDMLCESFCKEFGEIKTLKKELDKLYRVNRNLVEDCFEKDDNHYKYLEPFYQRRKYLNDITLKMLEYYSLQNIEGIHIPILPSIIHMSINRIFPASQRKYEMIMYYFLNKYYKKVFYSNLKNNS